MPASNVPSSQQSKKVPPPKRPLLIIPPTFTLAIGGTIQLQISGRLTGEPVWESSAIGILSVDANGLVTAINNGSATITLISGSRTATSIGTVVGPDPPPISPLPPVAELEISQVITVAEPVQLSTANSRDPDGALVAYSINWGDGQTDSDNVDPPQFLNHTYNDPGTYEATLTVTDDGGRTASAKVTIELPDVAPTPQPPVAVLDVTVQADAGSPSEIDTTGTTDPDGTIVSYRVEWGDATSTSASTPPPTTIQHTYAQAGVYTVRLSVTDNSGLTNEAATTITVQAGPPPPTPPSARLAYVSGADTGDPYVLSTTGTSTGLTSYTINWGDGTIIGPIAGDAPATLEHDYEFPGTYIAQLSVLKNSLPATSEVTLSVASPPIPDPPRAAIAYLSGSLEDEPYTLRTNGTSEGLTGWEITWGDGQSDDDTGDAPDTLEHTYANAGTYQATFTVTSPTGVGEAVLTITILPKPAQNQIPVAAIARIAGLFVGDTYIFDTTGTQDLDGSIASWTINFGDNTGSNGSGTPPTSFSRAYQTSGNKTITWVVTDNVGATNSKQITVSVAPAPSGGAGPHAYFNGLMARPERIRGYSLRTQAEINARTSVPPSFFWRYLYGTGQTHPYAPSVTPLDAAMCAKPPRANFSDFAEIAKYGNVGDENFSNQQILRFSVSVTSGTLLITWDTNWDQSFQDNAGWGNNPVNAWKTFFLFAGAGAGGTNLAWCGHDHTGNAHSTPGAVSKHHESLGTSTITQAPGVTARDPYSPTGQGAVPARSFTTFYNRWTRYWLECRMARPGSEFTEWSNLYLGGAPLAGTWDMMSLWIADEQRDAQRVFYRVPVTRRPTDMLAGFRFSWDTSTNNINGGGLVGPIAMHCRNLVQLQNYFINENDMPRPEP